MTEEPSTVLIIDDDGAIRSGLTMLLRSYGYEVESFASAAAFLERCANPLTGRYMAILDLSMPRMSGIELQSELKRRHIDIPTIFLSGEGDIPAAVKAVQQGAIDFVEKPVDTELLIERIDTALAQQRGQEPNNVSGQQIQSRLDSLTPREREVLRELAGGKISKRIARDLHISERTVELHRSRILKKMGVRHTTELLQQVIPVLEPEDAGEQ